MILSKKLLGYIGFAFALVACGEQLTIDDVEQDLTAYTIDYKDFPEPVLETEVELTQQKVLLGKMLFYEKQLSRDNSISCGSCHKQSTGFSDSNRLSKGVDGTLGGRQAMAITNMLWHTNEFFWDGRAHLLRDQAVMPIQDPHEMKETLDNVIAKLQTQTKYQYQFKKAFGTTKIDAEKIALALEQFMFTLVSNNSKYDKYLRQEATLTESEERGRALFFTEFNPAFPELSGADCAHCHSGRDFRNNRYMNNGLDAEAEITDVGRMQVTGDEKDKGKFKVTSLRNIALTAPYMHDGRFTTLEEVVEHYNSGIQPSQSLDLALEYTRTTGLMLTEQDKADLIAFLHTLTDEEFIANKAFSDNLGE